MLDEPDELMTTDVSPRVDEYTDGDLIALTDGTLVALDIPVIC